MAKLSEQTRAELLNQTVSVLLDLRSVYLANGASPLKHWDQILDRMRAATRTTSSVPEWVTAVARGLQIGTLTSFGCSSVDALVRGVGSNASGWLDFVEREHGYIIACARIEADKRRADRIEHLEGDEQP